jgi:hypothetical protein
MAAGELILTGALRTYLCELRASPQAAAGKEWEEE